MECANWLLVQHESFATIVANTPVLGKATLIVLPQRVAQTCHAEVGYVILMMVSCSGSRLIRK